MLKKVFLFFLTALLCEGAALAGPYDAFDYVLNRAASEKTARRYLEAFTKDIGQAISGGSYGIGGNLGISGSNLNLSLKMSYQEVSGSNIIVKTSGNSAIYYPVAQAELEFIERCEAIARFSYFNGSALFGGGLRYKIVDSAEKIYIPSVSVQSVYNYLVCDENESGKFNIWNLKTGTTAYFGLIPHIQPYVFLTYDITALKPLSSFYSYLSSRENGFGCGAGADINMHLLNITVSLSVYDKQSNISFGAYIGI